MFGLLITLFVILCLFLALFILIQAGKGDMGLGSLGGGSQMLFGGTGGQEFFEKATWIMGALFICGALGLTMLKTKETESSRLADYQAPLTEQKKKSASEKPATSEQSAPEKK